MAKQVINVGTSANDGTGDKIRVAFQKSNANFTELYDTKLESVVAGTNVTVDNTDPLNPIISATGGGGSQTLAETLVLGNTTGGENIEISDGDGVFMDNGSRLIKGVTDAGLGGAKGIALKCSIDYEYKWEAGRLYVLEQDGFTIRETKYNFNTAPTVNDDSTKGFVIASRWLLDNGDLYICEDDNPGVAVWELQTNVGAVDSVNGQTGVVILTTDNIADSVNKRYQTDAQETVNDATSSIQTQLNSKEATANKQNSLAVDGTGVKFPTVDAVNTVNTNAVDKITVKLSQAINKGQAVYISGANGTNILVSKASNTSEATSSKTLGLLETSGANNAIVNVITSGLIDGLNTSTATIGDSVWLGVSGDLIYGLVNKPIAPAHLVYIGVVSRVSATVGEIIVKVQNGFELKEIHDVLITSVANNQGLFYDSADSLWKNKTIGTVLGYTPANDSAVVHNTGAETIAGAKTFSSLLTMPSTGIPRILIVESSGQISGLYTATYPTPTELSLVKGVTGSAIQTQIDLRQPYAIARTTTAITFDVPAIYNSFSSPQTGTLTSSLTGARIGVVQVIYLNVATFPTLTGWVNIGSRAFQASVVNIIYAKWSEGSRVEYWISKATA